MKQLKGVGVSRGIAIGKPLIFDSGHKSVSLGKARDAKKEALRFASAQNKALEELERLRQRALHEIGLDESLLFEIQKIMLGDMHFINQVDHLIKDERYNAQSAVQLAGEQFAQTLFHIDDDYLSERGVDVLDASRRVVNLLCGHVSSSAEICAPSILAADRFMPSDMIQLDAGKVLALVSSGGSRVSHAAILARTMGIPAVTGLQSQINEIEGAAVLIVDGSSGKIFVDPDERTLQEYRQRQRQLTENRERLCMLRGLPSQTRDGFMAWVDGNIFQASDADMVLENDGEGIGMFHTEYLFSTPSGQAPDEETQFEVYKSVAEKMGGRPVVVRIINMRADKLAKGMRCGYEDNPAMGCRGVRNCLRKPYFFSVQLRALLRASAFGDISILLPFVNFTDEVRAARQILDDCKDELRQSHIEFNEHIRFGVSIETPGAALIAPDLANLADFFVVDADDLTQFTLAVDRMNGSIGSLFNYSHHAVLRLISSAADAAVSAGISCGICGAAASDRKLTGYFLRMGITRFAVYPDSILEVREQIRALNMPAYHAW